MPGPGGQGPEKEPAQWDQNSGTRKCRPLCRGSGLTVFTPLILFVCFSLALSHSIWLVSLFIFNISTSLSCSKENTRKLFVSTKKHTHIPMDPRGCNSLTEEAW